MCHNFRRKDCNTRIDGVTAINSLNITCGYSETINQTAELSVTRNFNQAAGTFLGSASSVATSGTLNLTAGTFQAPTSNLEIRDNLIITGQRATTDFVDSDGTLLIGGPCNKAGLTASGVSSNNFQYTQTCYFDLAVHTSMTIRGDFTLNVSRGPACLGNFKCLRSRANALNSRIQKN